VRTLAAFVLGLVATATPAAAAPADDGTDTAELQSRLDALVAEEAQVESHARELEEQLKARLQERRAHRHDLAGEVLAQELERHALRDRLNALAATRDDERKRADALRAFFDVAWGECVGLADQLVLLRDGMPSASTEEVGIDALRRELGDESRRAGSVAGLPAAFDAIHRVVGSLAVTRASVRTASGRVEDADLLVAGNVAFAYRVGDRRGLALASPSDASGFRWTERLDAPTRKAVDRAFEEVGARAAVCDVPLDASGMLRVDSMLDRWSLARVWESGGPVMWPLAAVAVLALLLVLERIAYLAREGGRSERLLSAVIESCATGEIGQARERCAKGRGLVARGLSACLTHFEGGPVAMEDGFQEQLLRELPRLERSLSGIGTLAAVAPLLGLLGTVTGIIQTFGVIRIFGNANPGLMAGGIAEALVTTATGLVIAIPTLLAHSLLRSRVELLTGYAEESAATLLNRLRKGGES